MANSEGRERKKRKRKGLGGGEAKEKHTLETFPRLLTCVDLC